MFLLEVRFHVNKTFSYEKFSTRTHFEAEAQGNFTIAHFTRLERLHVISRQSHLLFQKIETTFGVLNQNTYVDIFSGTFKEISMAANHVS